MALVGLVSAAPARAETAWKPFRGLRLIVQDVVDAKGMVFAAGGHFLVSPSTGTSYYLVSAKDLAVHKIERDLGAGADAFMAVDIAKKAEYPSAGVLSKDGATLSWKDGDARFSLASKPPLLGEVTLEALREHTQKYEAAIADYQPKADAVAALHEVSTPTEIVAAFGIWCSVCAEWLPRFIKTMDAAANPNLRTRYISINEALDQPAELMKEFGLDGVPIFAVRRGGKEIGRVTGDDLDANPDVPVEQALVRLISGG